MTILHTGELNDAALTVLQDKVAVLNRRATRLGLKPLVVRVVGVREGEGEVAGIKRWTKFNQVELCGECPRINGWRVAAVVEFTPGGNIVRSAPDETVDPRWRTCGSDCEHCNTRRYRKDVIVIKNDDGREKIVGRNCLADYIRCVDAGGFLAWADWLANAGGEFSKADDDYEGGGRVVRSDRIETVLAAATLCTRRFGWVSKSAAYDNPGLTATAANVEYLLYGSGEKWRKWVDFNELHISDDDKEVAERALGFALNISDDCKSDYLHNVRVICKGEWVGEKNFGIAVSIVSAYRRAFQIEQERVQAKKPVAVFVGNVKDRLRGLIVTVKRVRFIESDWGVKTIVTFEHKVAGGNKIAEITWFATNDRTEDWCIGTSYSVDATVKQHKDDPKWGKSTIVNRVSKKEELSECVG